MGKYKVASVAVLATACLSVGVKAESPSGWRSPLSLGSIHPKTATANLLSSHPLSPPDPSDVFRAPILVYSSSLLSDPVSASAGAKGGSPSDQHLSETVALTADPSSELTPLKIGEREQPQTTSDVPAATLYSYQMDGQEVATVYLKDLPIVSFVEHPDLESPLLRASSLVAQLNQLAQHPSQNDEVSLGVETVAQDSEKVRGRYIIQLNGQILLPIDEEGILLVGEKSYTTVALMATNRLRRLLFQAPPIQTPPTLPQELPLAPADSPTLVGQSELVPSPTYREEGFASWYGHGQQVQRLTAAHRELPFGTKVRVTNLENGKTAVVTINDRGPFLRGRVIDLSRAAAQTIDMIRSGVVKVHIEVVDP